MEKISLISAAYLPMDGMNEKGLAITTNMSYQGPGNEIIPTDLDNGKLNLTTTALSRFILDRAATVEEAVDLAKNISLHDDSGNSFHYFVADASGKSAVMQWTKGTDSTDTDGSDREFSVIYYDEENPFIPSKDYHIITNFITLPDYYEEDDIMAVDRFKILKQGLEETNGIVKDEVKALDHLAEVAGNRDNKGEVFTAHSVVYNLSKKSLTLAAYENYEDQVRVVWSMDSELQE